ncbi:hypothetical protein ACIO1C_01840 [Streptomyces sp. NPDC087420]|uniref:hypothetical protein n=1 Tax=Streptomyces sp. NPDC087420 TaxID=3365785 RepID=UPI003833409E
MDASGATTLVAAAVGVVGTLLSALLTQRAADRGRQREADRDARLRERRSHDNARRAVYVTLNTAARQYLAALTDHLHALRRAADTEEAHRRLVEARDLHREVHAEVQLLVPDALLEAAGEVSHALNGLYGMVRRLDGGVPRPGDSLDSAQAAIDELWTRLRELRARMRAELGDSRSDSGH